MTGRHRDDEGGALLTVFAGLVLMWLALALELLGYGIFALSVGALLLGCPIILGGIVLGIMAAVR